MNTESAKDYLQRLRRQNPSPQHWDWEATLARSYCRLLSPGAVVLDIGAHTGRHVEVFLGTVGAAQILAVEPQPVQAAVLQQRFGAAQAVQILRCALGNEEGTACFVVNHAAPEESGLRRRRYNNETTAAVENINVDVATIDLLLPRLGVGNLDFIKIDVEGAEIDVLQGGTATLRQQQPLVAIEYGSPSFSAYGRTAGDLYDLAASLDYVLMDLLGHPCSERKDWLDLVDAYYWDFLLVPQARAVEISAVLAADAWPVVAAANAAGTDAADGLTAWASRALAGITGKNRVEKQILQAYLDILGRAPDAEGLAHYIAAFEQKRLSDAALRAQLQDSEEYRQRVAESAPDKPGSSSLAP